MKHWLTGFVVAGIMVGGASLGWGEDAKDKKKDKPQPDLDAQFKKLDTNGNGFLVIPEYVGKKEGEEKTKAEKLFRRKDKDKDLQLTPAEFKAPDPPPKKKKKDNAKKGAANKKGK